MKLGVAGGIFGRLYAIDRKWSDESREVRGRLFVELLRAGPVSAERQAVTAEDGRSLDPSGVVRDINGDSLATGLDDALRRAGGVVGAENRRLGRRRRIMAPTSGAAA
jgi:hypothetical protein